MKVLVTRARDAAEATAVRLRQHGHEPVLLPLTVNRDTGAPLPAADFDAIAFTSAAALATLAGRPAQGWSYLLALPAFCVGEATARAARKAGFRETVNGPGTAPALADLVAAELRPDEGGAHTPVRLLYLAARDRSFDLAAALTPHGIEVTETEIYAAETVDPGADELEAALRNCTGGAAFLYSQRGAMHLVDLAAKYAMTDRLAGLTLIAISENVAQAIAGHGFPDMLVSEKPHEDGLFEALDRLDRNGRAAPEERRGQ